jgi:hypothetical protein
MSWLVRNLTKQEVKNFGKDGTFRSLYDSSKAGFDTDSNYDYPVSGLNDEQKLEHWHGKVLSYATPCTVKNDSGEDYDHYCLGLFQDNYLVYIFLGYYDDTDTSYNDVFGIARGDQATGSKAYLFMKEANNAKYDFYKNLGANKLHSYCTPDGELLKTLQSSEAYSETGQYILDFSSLTVTDHTDRTGTAMKKVTYNFK